MVQLLRLLSAAALPLCRAAGNRARLSAATTARLLAAGYRSYAATVSGVGHSSADMLSLKCLYSFMEEEKQPSIIPNLSLPTVVSGGHV